MKGFTDLDQSRKLAEFLPIESADMWYHGHGSPWESEREYDSDACPFHSMRPNWDIPCWSLAALMDVLPSNKNVVTTVSRGGWQMEPIDYLPNVWWCEYEDDENLTGFNVSADNPVDACYKMILKLHEQNLL